MKATPVRKTLLVRNLKASRRPNLKELPQKIMATKEPIDSFEKSNTYQFTSENKNFQVVIDKAKSLITDLFTLNKENQYLEKAHYDYNDKGQMIAVSKKGVSSNGKKNSVRTRIKYSGKNIIVSKDINYGKIGIQTIFGFHQGKKTIDLTINKPQEGLVEHTSYVEDKTLEETITKDNEVKFEGFGDPLTGEMVFSRSSLQPLSNFECCELLDNHMYHKQIYFDNFKTVVTREVPPTNADCFAKNSKDMVTPQQELVTTIKNLLY